MRVASIDLGSNTFEILIADKNETNIKPVFRKLSINRLAGGFNSKTRLLSEESILRALEVMSEYSAIINKKCVDRTLAVATSVVRNAVNSSDFLQRIYSRTGIEVEIISGFEESRLSSLGVVNSSEIKTRYCLVVDIGGGSTELSLVKNGKFLSSSSVNLGVVHLSENFIKGHVPTSENLLAVKEYISDSLHPFLDEIISIQDLGDFTLVFNAGTPLTMACSIKGIDEYDPQKVDGCFVSIGDVNDFYEKIVSVNSFDRIKLFPAISNGREDLVIPGTMIIREILKRLKVNSFKVSSAGILEALIYQIQ